MERTNLPNALSEASQGALPPGTGESRALSSARVSRIRAAVVLGKKSEMKLSRLEETYGLASSLDTERVRRAIIASAAECALRAESARAQYWLIKTPATTTHGARHSILMRIDMFVNHARWVRRGAVR